MLLKGDFMLVNMILNTDSYKSSHYKLYPKQSKELILYCEARGGGKYDKVMFFGMQAFINEYLCKPISMNDILEAEEIITKHGLPFNKKGWLYILEKYNGFLPVQINCAPEGSFIPTSNVLFTIKNTDPNCFWLAPYLETSILRAIWYPSTVATISANAKIIIKKFMNISCDNLDGLDFKLHDFGSRGVSSLESSVLGGAAHLINFLGTDNLPALIGCKKYYDEDIAGFSIPAAEHSTIISWGGKDMESKAYNHILKVFNGKHVSIVSDSYDLHNALKNIWGEELKKNVENFKGTIVIRPDSGNPVEIIMDCLNILDAKFGSTLNSKGYKVLPDFIRIIQGDGVNLNSIGAMLASITDNGFSIDNIVFGMGGELLQNLNRDDLGFTMKLSNITYSDDTEVEVCKSPTTNLFKKSKSGRLALCYFDNQYHTVKEYELGDNKNLLEKVFYNGKIISKTTLSKIRNLASSEI